jgi:hypothetical protein
MMLCRFVEMMLGKEVMPVRRMRMVSSLFMIAVLEMLGGFFMMGRRMPGMLGSFLMMIGRVLSHDRLPFKGAPQDGAFGTTLRRRRVPFERSFACTLLIPGSFSVASPEVHESLRRRR